MDRRSIPGRRRRRRGPPRCIRLAPSRCSHGRALRNRRTAGHLRFGQRRDPRRDRSDRFHSAQSLRLTVRLVPPRRPRTSAAALRGAPHSGIGPGVHRSTQKSVELPGSDSSSSGRGSLGKRRIRRSLGHRRGRLTPERGREVLHGRSKTGSRRPMGQGDAARAAVEIRQQSRQRSVRSGDRRPRARSRPGERARTAGRPAAGGAR